MNVFALLSAPLALFAVLALPSSRAAVRSRRGLASGLLIGLLALLIASWIGDPLGPRSYFGGAYLRFLIGDLLLPVVLPFALFLAAAAASRDHYDSAAARNVLLSALVPFGVMEAFSFAGIPDPLVLVLPQGLRICAALGVSFFVGKALDEYGGAAFGYGFAAAASVFVPALCPAAFASGRPGLGFLFLALAIAPAVVALILDFMGAVPVQGIPSETAPSGPDAQ